MPSRGIALIVAGMLLAPAALATSALAQDATPAAECAATTEDENKALVLAFFDAAQSGDGPAFGEILAPDHVYHELSVDVPVATPESGAEGASDWADERNEAITELTATIDPIMADGDLVSTFMTWTGKDADTGAEVTWNSAGLFRIACGKIAENWVVADTLGRLVTSGDITADELTAVTAEGTPVP